ncbi:MAG: hypothetical protein M3239_07830, partial [Thermoproteota archaeon]|nr:hypothetical protein [Thermoproteota archaeon]
LGGIVIVERLHALLVTAHLGLGIVLFSMMVIIVLYAYRIDYYEKAKVSQQQRRQSVNIGG